MSTHRADIRAQQRGLPGHRPAETLTHRDLREGAREQAAYVAAQPSDTSGQLPEQRPGHTGEVPFPGGKYPASYAEVVGQQELQAAMIERLAQRIEALETATR